MSAVEVGSAVGAPAARAARRPSQAMLTVALVFFGLLLASAVLLPAFHLVADPNHQDLTDTLREPFWGTHGSFAHPLGTDQLGRDVLARMVYGCRLTFVIAALGTLSSAVPGVILGLVAGYRRGVVDVVISRVVDAQLALPFILVAIAVIAARGRSLVVLIAVLAIGGWANYARVIRSEAIALRERTFVSALTAAGVRPGRMLWRHVLPNLSGTVVVLATLNVGTVILAESALSFLGLGVTTPDVSWGAMLADGRELLTQAWWVAALPGLAITVVVLFVNLTGDALVVRFDPKRRTFT